MRLRFLSFALLLHATLIAQSFVAETEAKTVLQGSSFTVKFNLINAEGSQFIPPDFSPFQVLSGPSRSIQTSIVNGRRSSRQGYVFELVCNKMGQYTIPAARIRTGGKELRTQPLTIEVVKAHASAAGNASDVFIEASLDKTEVFLGEQCVLTYKLFTRVNIESVEAASRPSLDAFHHLPVNMLNNPVQREVYKGREYMTRILSKTSLYPIQEGKLQIDPVVYRIVRGDDDPFGFGMGSFFRQQMENLTTQSNTLKVKALPHPSPPSFSGAVGQMDMTIERPNRQYGSQDAILMKIQIRGNANFNGLLGKFIEPDSTYEITDAKASEPLKITDEPEMIHNCQFEFLLIPKSLGAITIKPHFVYFDPKANQYQTIRDSFTIQISNQHVAVDTQTKPPQALMELRTPGLLSRSLEKNPLSFLFMLFPVGVWLVCHVWKKKSAVEPNQSLPAGDVYATLDRRFIEQVSKLGGIPLAGLNRQGAVACLQQKVMDQNCTKLLEWLRTYEQLKYSGQLHHERYSELLKDLESIG